MALDPRTPLVVGAGQVTPRPGSAAAGRHAVEGRDAAESETDPPDPISLMTAALRAAAEDASGVAPGAPAVAGDRLLVGLDSLRVVAPLSQRGANPGFTVAERLGSAPREIMLTVTGGNMPVSLLHDSARAIARGEADVIAVTGAEALYERLRARRRGERVERARHGDPDGKAPPVRFGTERAPANDLEIARGLHLPIHAYPLFENALRRRRGWSLDEHRAQIGALWARFSDVAAQNRFAWRPEALTPEVIVQPTAGNRMVSYPYTKLCTANLQVDQGAAYICCSVRAAQAAGIPSERWVFPLSGADAADHWYVSERPDLGSSPAIAIAGRWTFAAAGVGVDELGPVDLYSCFPCVVRIGAEALGLPDDDPARPLTVTGGLTFAGGPGNNYASHAIASMLASLRARPGDVGLVTGLGWYATKHSIALLASRPPDHEGLEPYRWADVQHEVDVTDRATIDPEASGEVTIETYTVTYDRTGAPEFGIVVCRTPDGRRAWANARHPDTLVALVTEEPIGRSATVSAEGELHIS